MGRDEPRAWRLVLGIVMAVIGAVAIYTAKVTGILSVIMAGTALGVAGFVEVLSGLGRGSRRVQPLRLMGGLLSMIVGVLFVFRPQVGLAGLTMMLAAYFIASGLFHARDVAAGTLRRLGLGPVLRRVRHRAERGRGDQHAFVRVLAGRRPGRASRSWRAGSR